MNRVAAATTTTTTTTATTMTMTKMDGINSNNNRHFVLCESCFWSATIIFFDREDELTCPSCGYKRVSRIPLAIDEEYRIKLSPSMGIEMSFSRAKKGSQ
jgi:hypothetical protein